MSERFEQEFEPDSDFKSENFNNKNEEKGRGINRRRFLKGLIIGAGAILTGVGIKEILDSFNKEKSEKEDSEKEDNITEEQSEILEEDIQSIWEILDFDKEGKINIDSERYIERMKSYWKKEYTRNLKLKKSFIDAYREIGSWRPYLEEIFQNNNVPKEFIYLAIPESHWQLEAKSGKGAKGPYQFIYTTARAYGLRIGGGIDERIDPLRSAEACAKFLRDLYNITGSWELALSGYNGGFIWRYIGENKDKKLSYPDFLKFLEKEINKIRDNIKDKRYFEYEVKKGDNLYKISQNYGVSVDLICRLNNLDRKEVIKINQVLKIPLKEEQLKKLYRKKINGFAENLVYPAKFYAVLDLIKDGFVVEQNQPVSFKVIKVGWSSENDCITHTIEKGETFYSLSRRYKIETSEIELANPGIKPERLKIGDRIKIPTSSVKKITLESIADKNNVSIERIKFLNPGILNLKTPLPNGYEVRY